MAPKIARLSLTLAICLFVSVCLIARVTPSVASGGQACTAKTKTAHETASATGCVQKGVETGGYILTADDDKVWELSSRTVKLDKHVGHKVTVTGTEVHRSKTAEAKMETHEKQEAAGKT